MRAPTLLILAATLTASLSACETLGLVDDEPAASQEPALPPKVAVTRIENLELGRTFDGFVLTAFATAPGTGYYQPELRPRFGGASGPDGFLEFDFVVQAPADPGQGAGAPVTARLVRGDTTLDISVLSNVRGVRVWSAQDSVEGLF